MSTIPGTGTLDCNNKSCTIYHDRTMSLNLSTRVETDSLSCLQREASVERSVDHPTYSDLYILALGKSLLIYSFTKNIEMR